MEIILDAADLVIGRMCSYAAKRLMLGDTVKIVNCEKAVISGNKYSTFNKYKERREKGQPTKGVFYPRRPDLFVKRIMRGMIPYKQFKGKAAYQSLRCYIGVPEEFKNKTKTIKEANLTKLSETGYITVKQICRLLGGKV